MGFFKEGIFGNGLPPEGESNPVVADRIIHYFTSAGSLSPEDLEQESFHNPIRQLTEDYPITQREYRSFLRSLVGGEYDELSIHFFKDLTSKASPLSLSDEKRIENLHRILVDPILLGIGEAFENQYYYGEKATVDPQEIEETKQRVLDSISYLPEKLKAYQARFREFLYLHFGPAMEYSEQFNLLLQEAEIEFPSLPRKKHKSRFEGRGNSPWNDSDSYDYDGDKQQREPVEPPEQNAILKSHIRTLGLGFDEATIRAMPLDELDRTVRQAYRRRALSIHPDRGGPNQDMVALNNAHDALKEIIKSRRSGN